MLDSGGTTYNLSDLLNNQVKSGGPNTNSNNPPQITDTSYLGTSNFFNAPPPPVQATNAAPQETGIYKGSHPIAALFHVLFKGVAFLFFMFGNLFTSSYVTTCVLTIIFCAADFWITKNVTGRLLVSLRWWNQVREDGTTHWVFESAPDAAERVNSYDNWLFWISLGLSTTLWLLLCILNLMSLSWLPVALMGFVLSGANLLGYIKCRRDAKGRVTDFIVSQTVGR